MSALAASPALPRESSDGISEPYATKQVEGLHEYRGIGVFAHTSDNTIKSNGFNGDTYGLRLDHSIGSRTVERESKHAWCMSS